MNQQDASEFQFKIQPDTRILGCLSHTHMEPVRGIGPQALPILMYDLCEYERTDAETKCKDSHTSSRKDQSSS